MVQHHGDAAEQRACDGGTTEFGKSDSRRRDHDVRPGVAVEHDDVVALREVHGDPRQTRQAPNSTTSPSVRRHVRQWFGWQADWSCWGDVISGVMCFSVWSRRTAVRVSAKV